MTSQPGKCLIDSQSDALELETLLRSLTDQENVGREVFDDKIAQLYVCTTKEIFASTLQDNHRIKGLIRLEGEF